MAPLPLVPLMQGSSQKCSAALQPGLWKTAARACSEVAVYFAVSGDKATGRSIRKRYSE